MAVVSSDNRVWFVDIDNLDSLIGTVEGSSISGVIYSSSVAPATAKVTSVSDGNISGTYTSSLGGGSFALVSDPNLYNRGASLAKLSGVWVDDTLYCGNGYINLDNSGGWLFYCYICIRCVM